MNQDKKVVKISDIIDSQIPEFILSENPNFSEFLKQYYVSQEYQGSTIDLAENLVSYKNIDSFDSIGLTTSTTLTSEASFFDDVINVASTSGWPNQYGLLQIDNEIISYTGITSTSFTGCIRGFSGVETLSDENNPGFLKFSSSEVDEHSNGSIVKNLSNLFLLEFFRKIKYQFTPGFENIDFDSRINAPNFISKAKDFYKSKGTEEAFKILFKVLYGEKVEVIKPKDFVATPSDSKWIVVERFIGQLIEGNPNNLKGQTLYQDKNSSGTILEANGSIYEVSSFSKNYDQYYNIDIFSGYSNNLNPKGSIFGQFKITPKTYVISDVSSGSDTIRVVSTIGFEQSGSIIVNGITINYTDKTDTEFIGCIGISSSIPNASIVFGTNYVYSQKADGSIVKFRILNTLSNIDSNNTKLASEYDFLKIDNIGITSPNVFTNSLSYNVPTSIVGGTVYNTLPSEKYGIDKSTGLVRTKYPNYLKNGDFVEVFSLTTNQKIYTATVSNVNNQSNYSFSISDSSNLTVNHRIKFRRVVKTSTSTNYPDINGRYLIDIQSSYEDDDNYYLTSNGFPSGTINPYKKEFNFDLSLNSNSGISSSFIGLHNFYDGEIVSVVGYSSTVFASNFTFTNKAGIQTGLQLYVKKIDSDQIKLCYTRNDLIQGRYINFAEASPTNTVGAAITTIRLSLTSIYRKNLYPLKLFKKLPKQVKIPTKKYKTLPGSIGVLYNGTEIQNVKSFDKIYYGEITSIDVLNGGSNYDLLNPPKILVNNGQDTTTKTYVSLKGYLQKILVTDPGYDYVEEPIVEVRGGNNNNIKVSTKMKKIQKEFSFNAGDSSVVNTLDGVDKIIFGYSHRLVPGDALIYSTQGNSPIGIGTEVQDGFLLNNGVYYISNVGSGTSFSLYSTYSDAISGINTINLRTRGTGIQKFTTEKYVNVVDRINVIDNGGIVDHKVIPFKTTHINKYDNIITLENHGFKDGEEVVYQYDGETLTGINTTSYYYIKVLDKDSIKLYTNKTLTGSEVNIDFGTLQSSSVFSLRYSPLRVEISGKLTTLGISTIGYSAEIKPIVLGEIYDVRCFNSLTYGNTFLNVENGPTITLQKGTSCTLKPLVFSGKLVDVIVLSGGSGYYNNVEIKVNGKGTGAILTPIISNGVITDVKLINGGVGYDQYTTLEVIEVGTGAFLKSNLNTFTINEVSKYSSSQINSGILVSSNYSGKSQIGIYYLTNSLSSSIGINSTTHSPIIGWAYDGCPIYGPFAYANVDGTGNIIRMTSSYRNTRVSPSVSNSINLDCIEDYVYEKGLGTLDEFNGRYCKTPEFPNGVYAYFSTSSYPFFIGENYKYEPVEENFYSTYNQDIDLNELDIIKHTYPYYVEDKEEYYEFFDFYPSIEKEDFIVLNTQVGNIDGLDVIYPGTGYYIGDEVIFDNTGTSGYGAKSIISELEGVGISSIASSSTSYNNITFLNNKNTIIGISSVPLNLKDNYYVKISGISTSKYSGLEGFERINFETVTTKLTKALPSNVGLVTSIEIRDSITKFNINEKLQVGGETLTIIGFNNKNNQINVKRGNTSSSHSSQSDVNLLQNKFTFSNSEIKDTLVNDEVYYFESNLISVGVGTTPGNGNTLYRRPLGVGITESKYVRTGGIWMPGHKFVSGEEVDYEIGDDCTQIVTTIDGGDFLENINPLYVVDLGNDIIGLTNDKKSVKSLDNLIYYPSSGSGNLHQLKTKRNLVKGNIQFNDTTVYTNESHNLSVNDVVTLSAVVGNTTSFTVSYSSASSRLLVNSSTNPNLKVYRNEKVEFNLSSSTLSGTEFKLYRDEFFENEYLGVGNTVNEVVKTNDKLTLNINSETPSTLYYNIVSNTKEVNIDTSIAKHNVIEILPSLYNIQSTIVGVSTSNFSINLPNFPEKNYYASIGSTILSYSVNSSAISGPIKSTRMIFKGENYKKLPVVVSIGNSGSDAKLYPYSNNIGKITKISPVVGNIYPSDRTLKPNSKLYSSLYLKDNYKVKNIQLINGGSNYLSAPKIKLYNQNTNLIYQSFTGFTELKNGCVDSVIIANSGFGIPENGNKIVFVENTNGIKILEATKQETSPGIFTVSLRLETPSVGFTTTNSLPFEIGDKIFVEGIQSVGNGFNSEYYSYNYFDVVGIVTSYSSPNQSIVRYNLNKDPGSVVSYDFAYVINSKNMPSAKVTMAVNEFYPNEVIENTNIVNNKDGGKLTSVVNVYDDTLLSINEQIKGDKSNSEGTIVKIDKNTAKFKLSESFSKELGSLEDRGYISSNLQKIQDSDYYQYFSYSLKSSKEIKKWESPVSDLAHISGFKKFSDLEIESVGVSTITTEDSSVVNVSLDSYVNVNTINNIDLVLEDVDENDNLYSETLTFNTIKLSDYLLSKENRVLSIDDISSSFDNDAAFAALDIDILPSYGSGSFISKYLIFIEGTTSLYTDFELPLFAELYLSRNGNDVNIISYSYFEDIPIGSFYSQVDPEDSTQVILQFIPFNINNIYSSKLISDIVPLDTSTVESNYGNVRNIGITTSYASNPSPSTIYVDLISKDSCNSGTVYVGVGTTNGHISEFIELSFVYNGQTLISNLYSDTEIKNLGTVGISTNGNNIAIGYSSIPNTNTYLYINASLLVNTVTSPSTINLEQGLLNSSRVQFTNSNLNAVGINTFSNEYAASKFVIEVKKTVGVTTTFNIIQLNSIHYNVIQGQEKYLNNISYGIIGNYDDLNFQTIYDEPAGTYSLIYYPNELATYDIKFYKKSILRSTNPILG